MRLLVRVLYAPIGITCGVIAGLLSRKLFTALWGMVEEEEPPEATTQEANVGKVVAAAALQAGVFAGTRAVVNRSGARVFYYFTGFWPGEREPDQA